MALGGGTFTVQNKIMPGSYINFVSASGASSALSERGIATMPLDLDWGVSGEIFEVTAGDFQKNSMKIFGYPYTHDKLKGLRDLFMGASTCYFYRLNGSGEKAKNDFASAKYPGTRGNDIRLVISENIDDGTKFDVVTYVGSDKIDLQTVAAAADLVSNDFVDFNKSAVLAANAGIPLTGGTNSEINGASYQAYLDKIEAYRYNTMGVCVTDDTTKRLFVSFNKRLRDEVGVKFQLVVYNYLADYLGVISVKNKCSDFEPGMVYWVTGAEAGCPVNRSVQNKLYDGEFVPDTGYTQNELVAAIKNGEFVFHKVDSDVRVLKDINTMVTTSDTSGDIFKENQTVRVIDQIANDIAVIFNTKYLGMVPNDNSGRISFWNDIVKHHEQLQSIRAIENFSSEDVKVYQGDEKGSVAVDDAVTIVNAMSKLYMTVTVS